MLRESAFTCAASSGAASAAPQRTNARSRKRPTIGTTRSRLTRSSTSLLARLQAATDAGSEGISAAGTSARLATVSSSGSARPGTDARLSAVTRPNWAGKPRCATATSAGGRRFSPHRKNSVRSGRKTRDTVIIAPVFCSRWFPGADALSSSELEQYSATVYEFRAWQPAAIDDFLPCSMREATRIAESRTDRYATRRAWAISRRSIGRSCASSSVTTAIVSPSSDMNSTSYAFPSRWTCTIVPTSPAASFSPGRSDVSTTRSCSLNAGVRYLCRGYAVISRGRYSASTIHTVRTNGGRPSGACNDPSTM